MTSLLKRCSEFFEVGVVGGGGAGAASVLGECGAKGAGRIFEPQGE